MHTKPLLSFLGGLTLFVAGYNASTETTPAAPVTAQIPISGNAPLVVFDITGSTLIGTIHRHLTVYNTGFVTISKSDQAYFPAPATSRDVLTTSIPASEAFNLLIDLIRAGAVTVPSQAIPVSDVPLTTLTILEGKQLAYSRSVSYWLGGPYDQINRVMTAFTDKHFPGF